MNRCGKKDTAGAVELSRRRFVTQGKISEVQLENYRRNSVTREPLDGEDQSPSSASR